MTYASTTTLNLIRAAKPCEDGWRKLLGGLGKTQADDEPLPLLRVLDINGLDDALWVLSYAMPDDRLARHFQAWCAEQVLHLFEAKRPGDTRVRDQIAMLRNDAATLEQRTAARYAASAAAWDAAQDAARYAASAAAWAAARDAAWTAARDAAWAAARDAARDAARYAALDAARYAAWDEQEKQLRAMIAARDEEGTREMTDLLALKELRDKVAAGTATKRDFILCDLVPNDRSAFRAFDGSLDAAKAMHDALLPGWRVEDMHQRPFGKWQVCIERVTDFVEVTAMDYSPARAWLLAILTALIAKNASNDRRAPE